MRGAADTVVGESVTRLLSGVLRKPAFMSSRPLRVRDDKFGFERNEFPKFGTHSRSNTVGISRFSFCVRRVPNAQLYLYIGPPLIDNLIVVYGA